MSSLTKFRLIAKEFSGELDTSVNDYLGMAELFVSAASYIDSELAIALKAASLMLTAKNSESGSSASSGVIKREKEGDIEREYSVNTSGYSSQNIYESMLKDLCAASGLGFGGSVTRMAGDIPAL